MIEIEIGWLRYLYIFIYIYIRSHLSKTMLIIKDKKKSFFQEWKKEGIFFFYILSLFYILNIHFDENLQMIKSQVKNWIKNEGPKWFFFWHGKSKEPI